MPSTVGGLARVCLVTTIVTATGITARAQEQSTFASHDLTQWVEQFPVPGSQLHETVLARVFWVNEEIRPFTGQSVVGLGINGRVHFTSPRGLVRIVVVDGQLHEYLIYETYPLIATSESLQIRNGCRETCLLPPTVPSALKVELVDASLDIQTIVINQLMTTAGVRMESAPQTMQRLQDVKIAQETEIIDALNRQIKAKGLKWIAGETPISRLSYYEKKAILSCLAPHPDAPPNLQGAEYYKGGILELSGTDSALVTRSSALIESFDWRSRHGANRPGSPYYDGDPTGGGWMTSIKFQLCGDCWAHSALGATEALSNLYFNQHLDLDLSEQELVSCGEAGSCSGGFPNLALSYVQTAGVVDEACFPESGRDESCGNCCQTPRERVMITGFDYINPYDGEDNIKAKLIASGPLAFGIISWWHALVLVGYDRDSSTGETVWIVKNSWGTGWGQDGYGYVKVGLNDMYHVYNVHTPVSSLLTPYTVACRDADGDGYFNWGIASGAALACGSMPPIEDCDDSDSTIALMTERGHCTAAPPIDTTAPVITVALSPSILWPPNGEFMPVVVSGTITDAGTGVNANTATYIVTDEYGRVELTGPVPLDANGIYTFTVSLEAYRRGADQDGRQYQITVSAQDQVGNEASALSVAVVPHDTRRNGRLDLQHH